MTEMRCRVGLLLGIIATVGGANDSSRADECAAVKLTPELGSSSEYFGWAADADLDRILIGGASGAYVYERSDIDWIQRAVLAPNGMSGTAVALEDQYMVIGDWHASDPIHASGAVALLEEFEGEWRHVSHVTGTVENGELGQSVAVSGEVVVAGAPGENGNKGRVHVYRRAGGEWIEEAVLLPPPTLQWFEGFGWEVAIDGDRIAVGDYSEWTDSSLRVVTFKHDDGEWVQESILDYSSDLGAIYGVWIDLYGEFMVVNGRYGDLNYLYEWVQSAWVQRSEFYGNTVLYAGQAGIDRNYVLEIFGPEGGRLHRRDGDAWIELAEFASPNNEFLPWGAAELSGAWAIVGDPSDPDDGSFAGAVHLIPLPIDCNNNGITDACDIATGASSDANADGVPDDCQPNDCPRGGCENLDIAGNDCVINLGDLGLLLANFNREGWDIAGDSDIDGDVDLADLGAMLAAWGSNCGWQVAEDEAR